MNASNLRTSDQWRREGGAGGAVAPGSRHLASPTSLLPFAALNTYRSRPSFTICRKTLKCEASYAPSRRRRHDHATSIASPPSTTSTAFERSYTRVLSTAAGDREQQWQVRSASEAARPAHGCKKVAESAPPVKPRACSLLARLTPAAAHFLPQAPTPPEPAAAPRTCRTSRKLLGELPRVGLGLAAVDQQQRGRVSRQSWPCAVLAHAN